jgi:hypothetical protein
MEKIDLWNKKSPDAVKGIEMFYDIDPSNIRFREPSGTLAGPFRSGTRINIYYQKDGKEYPLMIAPEMMFFSFGIREDVFSGKPTGSYSMCIVIDVDKDDESSKGQKFVDIIESIYDKCHAYVSKRNKGIKFGNVVKRYDKEDDTLQYRIYPKLIMTKDTGKVWSNFFVKDDVDPINNKPQLVDAMSLKEKNCKVFPGLLFDSLYFYQGGVSLQCKISQAVVEVIEKSQDELLLDMSRLSI